jgi:hypothetical protein
MFVDTSQNMPFWASWFAGLVICVHQTVHAFRRRESVLGIVPAVCLMYGYFYVLQSGMVGLYISDRVMPWILAVGQFAALISLVGFLVGWYKGVGAVRIVKRSEPLADPQSLFYVSVGAIVVGLIGMYSFFYSGADFTSTDAWVSNSAYWYLLFHVAYPGLTICVYLASSDERYRQASVVLLLTVLSVLMMYHWVYYARRSPVFSFLVVVIYGFYLARPYRVNRVVVISGLITAGLIMLLFFTIRDYSSEGASWSGKRLNRITATDVLLSKTYMEEDNEFLYNCAVSATCVQLDRFQWGTGYLSLFTHWIPRQWWPDKPRLGQGWFDPVSWPEISECTGVHLTPGATYSGVGEAFQEFGWFTPLFWATLGWLVGRLYRFAILRPNSVAIPSYVGVVAVSHHLIAQGFAAAFVPGMCYILLPVFLYAVTGNLKTSPSPVRRPVRRAPGLALH